MTDAQHNGIALHAGVLRKQLRVCVCTEELDFDGQSCGSYGMFRQAWEEWWKWRRIFVWGQQMEENAGGKRLRWFVQLNGYAGLVVRVPFSVTGWRLSLEPPEKSPIQSKLDMFRRRSLEESPVHRNLLGPVSRVATNPQQIWHV